MSEFLYQNKEFVIKKVERGYVVVNLNGGYNNHSHFNYSFDACRRCIELVQKNIIPRYSLYMMMACYRIALDPKYKEDIKHLIEIKKSRKQKCIKRREFAK